MPNRFAVPPGPIVGLLVMSTLAVLLVGVIIARSPDTHANIRPEGYHRTQVAYLDRQEEFEGVPLADPGLVLTGDPVHDGQLLFFGYGCASCHGLNAKGGVVGPSLTEVTASGVRRALTQGPKGMPVYDSTAISAEDVASIVAYLRSTSASGPAAPDSAPSTAAAHLPPVGLAFVVFAFGSVGYIVSRVVIRAKSPGRRS